MGKTVKLIDNLILKAMNTLEMDQNLSCAHWASTNYRSIAKNCAKRSMGKLFLLVVFHPPKTRGDIWEDMNKS